jgi:hypothetical protein
MIGFLTCLPSSASQLASQILLALRFRPALYYLADGDHVYRDQIPRSKYKQRLSTMQNLPKMKVINTGGSNARKRHRAIFHDGLA